MGYGDAASAPPLDRYPNFSVESEREFLGWTEGATPPALVALFDDFCDSSTIGMRYVIPYTQLLFTLPFILSFPKHTQHMHTCTYIHTTKGKKGKEKEGKRKRERKKKRKEKKRGPFSESSRWINFSILEILTLSFFPSRPSIFFPSLSPFVL